MNLINALAISIGILAAVATYLCLGTEFGLQVWALFIGWGSFYHTGGGTGGGTGVVGTGGCPLLLAVRPNPHHLGARLVVRTERLVRHVQPRGADARLCERLRVHVRTVAVVVVARVPVGVPA